MVTLAKSTRYPSCGLDGGGTDGYLIEQVPEWGTALVRWHDLGAKI